MHYYVRKQDQTATASLTEREKKNIFYIVHFFFVAEHKGKKEHQLQQVKSIALKMYTRVHAKILSSGHTTHNGCERERKQEREKN